ncbi:MAG: 2-succinyl-5-enolpyruvyl-6-hydroxy-3-cyclohexene-1-carboxylic-acid synthase [Gammaproteobacteria bacterium]
MDIADLNLSWAATLVEALAHSGVQHAVISPGSRSTPLTLACARHAGIVTWVLPDERTAAFFALGLARGTGTPPMVVATSGTAPANWYPAVIEANQDLQPLVFVSADRPAELQGCGANQTIEQIRLFGTHVRQFVQLPEPVAGNDARRRLRGMIASAADHARWPTPGPVHINTPLHEPLVPRDLPPPSPTPRTSPSVHRGAGNVPAAVVEALAERCAGGRGLIVCGRGDFDNAFAAAVTRLAARLACPILADPLSGLRFGPHDRTRVLGAYDAFLRRAAFVADHRPQWVLGLGAAPVSKALQHYLDASDETDTTLVVPHGPWPDPGRRASRVIHADPTAFCTAMAEAAGPAAPPAWCNAFLDADARARDLLARDPAGLPVDLAATGVIGRASPEGSAIFCGNSLVIRDVDTAMHGGRRHLRLVGNRGASGIDGNVSTTLGLAAAWPGPVIGLLGDLALYHDMNGLLAARGLDATLIVFNNGGGAIFEHLPQRSLPDFERFWLTPTALDIARVAALYDLRHARVGTAREFEEAFGRAVATPGVDLIEVAVERDRSLAWHRDYWARVAGDPAGRREP